MGWFDDIPAEFFAELDDKGAVGAAHPRHYQKKEVPVKMPEIGYYIMSGQRLSDGPFETQREAEEFLAQMSGKWATPELLAQFLARFDGTILDLVKDENGTVINGELMRERMPEICSRD